MNEKRGSFLTVILFSLFFLAHKTDLSAEDALLSWNPNAEPDLAGYKVYYGTASGGYGTPIDVGNQTTYAVTGLDLGTYYFAVTAYDAFGNESGYSNEAAKTLSVPDTAAPVISGITLWNVTSDGATISWMTDEPSDTLIQYGAETAYESSTSLITALVTFHSQSLTELQPSTTYNFRVISRDAAGNLAASGIDIFTTPKKQNKDKG